jgi:N-acetylglutamate synthase-like GNAT family acetyltransferase
MTITDKVELMPNIRIRHHFNPGDIGYLVFLHGTLYAQEFGWDHTFEACVAGPLVEFAKSHNDRQRIWIVEKDEKVSGSIAIVEAGKERAQLRWLLLHPNLRGEGLGRKLVEGAIGFCRESGYASVFLWTESRLEAAARLYRAIGFQLTEEKMHEMWGSVVTEQRYELRL